MLRIQTSRRDVLRHLYHHAGSPGERKFACEAPITLTLEGLPDPTLVRLGVEKDHKAFFDQQVRCRKCPPCLQMRSTLWTAKAIDEVALARRSWFGTLTLDPVQVCRFTLLADRRARARRCEPLSDMNSADRFKAIAEAASPELTKWLKRVRANSRAPLRYLLVCEAHKSGVPHWHCLIHEADIPVTKRTLDGAWSLGFSQFRLVNGDPTVARYVCKYLAKSALTRVRASQTYGRPPRAFLSKALSV